MDALTALQDVIGHPFTMLLCGLATNFGRKVLAAVSHQTGARPSFRDYWRKHPVQSVLSVVGALVGYAILVPSSATLQGASSEIWTLARTAAFGVGFGADNIADAIGESTLRRLSKIGPKDEANPPT